MRAYPTPDQEAIVRRIALEEGVDPRLLMSVWEQESSKSVDPTMTGPVLPEGHKYAGHYGRGPFQIMSFHGPIAGDFEGQARWAAKHLKERGVRGYYGTGKPPPGFPTTDEYEQQVMARVPGAGMLAQAGVADVPQGLGRQPQGQGFQQAPRAPEVQEMPQQAPMDGLLTNPYLLLGASILAANDSKNTAQVLGRGLLGGAIANDRAEQSRSIREYRQQQMQMQRMKEEAALRQQQAWDALMSSQGGGGGQLGGGVIGGLAQYAVASQDPDLLAKVMGLQMQQQNAQRPYSELTMAEQAAEAQRQWQRDVDLTKMQHEGVIPPRGGAAAGQPPAAPGLGISPAGMQEIAKEREKAKTTATADQKKYAGWAGRMAASEPDMERIEKKFYQGGGVSFRDYYSAENALTTGLASPEYQQYLTHARDWIGALLRYESGAAVPEPEFWRYYKTYFAQPGEDKSVIEIKQNKRRRAAASLGTAAGAAMQPAGNMPALPPGFVPEN